MITYIIVAGISAGISLIVSIAITIIAHFVFFKKPKTEDSVSKAELNEVLNRISALEKSSHVNTINVKLDSAQLEAENKHANIVPTHNNNRYESKKTKKGQHGYNKHTEPNKQQTPPIKFEYTYYGINGGQFVDAPTGSSYYRAWEDRGIVYYEFHCEDSKMAKAINNRSVLIEPFCRKDSFSAEADDAKSIVSVSPGILDADSKSISKKTIIKYI